MLGSNRQPIQVVSVALLALSLIVVAGCWSGGSYSAGTMPGKRSGVGQDAASNLRQGHVSNKPQRRAIGRIDDALLGKTVAVEGEVVQQCPAAGCWFRVRDGSGELFVDLNPAGLRLKQKRVGQRVRVTGRLAKIGNQYLLEATAVEFGSDAKADRRP